MDKILAAIEERIKLGYLECTLRVEFGDPEGTGDEGYYLSKINGWGSTPITEILETDNEINDEQLINQLNAMGIDYLL